MGGAVQTRLLVDTAVRRRLVLVAGGRDGSAPEPPERGRRRALQTVPYGRDANESRRQRVLLADDEPSMRLLCRINLDLAGFDVVEAQNGSEALAKARDASYDLVLLDVMMPDVSGHEVAEQLREDARTRELPIVFLSARASPADLRRGYELGALDYITKPFDPIALSARVEQVLDRIDAGEAEAYRRDQLDRLRRA